MKRLTLLTIVVAITLLFLPFSISAQTDPAPTPPNSEAVPSEPAITDTKPAPVEVKNLQVVIPPPEPIDQSNLVITKKTIQVEQVNITGTTGFNKEGQKFINALGAGGLDNIATYVHPLSRTAALISGKDTDPTYPVLNHLYKRLTFMKFIESKADSPIEVTAFYEGAFLDADGVFKNLVAMPIKEAQTYVDTKLTWKLATLCIAWVKTDDTWSIKGLNIQRPSSTHTNTPGPIDTSVEPAVVVVEPFDQTALSVQTETVMVDKDTFTASGFEVESQKFIKQLNENGLTNIANYLHSEGSLSRKIASRKTMPDSHLFNHFYKTMTFSKFTKNMVQVENLVVTVYEGSVFFVSPQIINTLQALPVEEGIKQMDATEKVPYMLGIVWSKTDGNWLIDYIAFVGPVPETKTE